MQEEQYKEVLFNQYCKYCKHEKEEGYDSVCEECLENPVNLYSHKPVKFEEKDKHG